MAVSKSVLGMNARNFLYIRPNNKASAKRRADDKLETKRMLLANKITTPSLLATFYTRKDVRDFDWNLPEEGFAIKPARGYGGGGILAFKKWDGQTGVTVNGEIYTKKQLSAHIFDLLDGAFSLQYLPDRAFIERLVTPHPFFKKFAPIGIADIRIIVFRTIPIMAMIRIPTKESGGKANLQQGAIAAGIDMRTGITTYATHHNSLIRHIPDTKVKASGIKLPDWDTLLLLASRTQVASGLGFAGVDLVIDAKKGPMVLEVNTRPGLKIQNANLASLRTRLERIEGMDITTPERGIEVAKSLFAESFSEKVRTGPKILPVIYPVTLKYKEHTRNLKAKLDTGAYRTSIGNGLVNELGIPLTDKKVYVKSASGKAYRPTVKLTFEMAGKKITTIASVVDRAHLKYPMIVGRIDLKGFLISPETEYEEEDVLVDRDETEE
jgi:alpha-L-glutamate ligase-like protein